MTLKGKNEKERKAHLLDTVGSSSRTYRKMCDYIESSQLREWLFSPELLDQCRKLANLRARRFLARSTNPSIQTGKEHSAAVSDNLNPSSVTPSTQQAPTSSSTKSNNTGPAAVAATPTKNLLPVEYFAAGYAGKRFKLGVGHEEELDTDNDDLWTSSPERGSQPLLSSEEEQLLIQFYSGRISCLIGPKADLPKCRRDIKVTATAALLFRRFYLSNSVMIHDPKALIVAAAFLASKVEDATADVRALEEATRQLKAHVTVDEIITSELYLLEGIHSDLMCFHPYKTLFGYSEDLRTYLRSKDGRDAISFSSSDRGKDANIMVSGEDLRPIHEEAWRIVEDACVSDIPLLYTPGQVGIAAMILANDELEKSRDEEQITAAAANNEERLKMMEKSSFPRIDLRRYLANRFRHGRTEKEQEELRMQIAKLTDMLGQLKSGNFGCGNFANLDMSAIRAVHKKLKRCKAWGEQEISKGDTKKKNKKRKLDQEE